MSRCDCHFVGCIHVIYFCAVSIIFKHHIHQSHSFVIDTSFRKLVVATNFGPTFPRPTSGFNVGRPSVYEACLAFGGLPGVMRRTKTNNTPLIFSESAKACVVCVACPRKIQAFRSYGLLMEGGLRIASAPLSVVN